MKTHYDLLGVPRTAEHDEIRRAFRREIARYHPDKVQHLGAEFQEIASARASALTEAYRILTHADERERYDQSLEGDEPTPVRRAEAPPEEQGRTAADPRPASFEPPPIRTPAPNHEDTLKFIRRAVVAKVKGVASELGGAMQPSPAFDAVIEIQGRRPLFRKPEPGIRVAIKILPEVDAPAVEQAWTDVLKLPAHSDGSCVMLLGRSLAPPRDLAAAVTSLRRKPGKHQPLIIPIDVRDWEALVPPETPVLVRGLIDRLRNSA